MILLDKIKQSYFNYPKTYEFIKKWEEIYSSNINCTDNLGVTICRELAKLITLEFKSEVDNEKVNNEYQKFLGNIREIVELNLAFGSVILKPIFKNNEISVDIILPQNFRITNLNCNNEIIGFVAIDKEEIIENKNIKIYYRLEYHYFDEKNKKYTIRNEVYSENENKITKVDLKLIDRWCNLKEIETYNNIDFPLFVYYKTPYANNLDLQSPLGISIFSDSVNNIYFHHELKGLLKGELSKTKSKIFADRTVLEEIQETDKNTFTKSSNCCELAKLEEDYFYLANFGGRVDESTPIHLVHPEIRNKNITEVINENLRLIEKQVGLHEGTLTETTQVARTATELNIMKQRTYTTIVDNQQKLEIALKKLVDIFNLYLNANKEYNIYFDFDDSIVSNRDDQFKEYQILLANGIITPVEFRMWYFGETEEIASRKIPKNNYIDEE